MEIFLNRDEEMLKSLNDRKLKILEKQTELIKQQATLSKQLDAINSALIGFGGEIIEEEANRVSKLPHEILSDATMSIPRDYTNDLRWAKKILFVINKLHKATVNEIVQELKNLEPELDELKIKKTVTFYASKLYTEKQLKAITGGKYYIYFIQE